jgi:DNA-binding MarR family transcriptional regulator
MPVRSAPASDLDQLSVSLLQQASLLTRLVFRVTRTDLSRSEASILATLESGPNRITTLAEQEGLAQPTVTAVVDALEQRCLVTRSRDAADGRVVLVSLTETGRAALAGFRESYRPLMRTCLAELPARQRAALDGASEALGALIDAIHEEASG